MPDLEPTATASLPVASRLVAAQWDSLFLHGTPTALEPPLVAIVGTRDADTHGLSLARAFAMELAGRGVCVVSGGALGIDAAAHAGALDAQGRTVVVLPCGLDFVYPLRHRTLYEHVVTAGGALVSPFPANTPPARWTFPRRNALLAALCDLLLVVQAPTASGSLITAEEARKLGRRVLVVPASPGDPRGTGCLKLLRLGAEMCATPADVLEALAHRDGPLQAYASSREPVRERPARAHTRTRTRERVHASQTERARSSRNEDAREPVDVPRPSDFALDETTRRVHEALEAAPHHLDEIVRTSGHRAAAVRASLMTLVLLGLAIDRGDGTFRRSG